MNRRDFGKKIFAIAATAAVAPKVLIQQPEFYPESNCPITLKMLQDAYGAATFYGPAPNLFLLEIL